MWAMPEGRERHSERGTSIMEVMTVLALTSLLLTITAGYSVSWIGREELRAAASELRTQLNVTRAHAINRNRACRLQLDTTLRRVQIYDLVDKLNNADDILIKTVKLPDDIVFSRPDSGSAVTFPLLSGTTYQATFESNGSVSSATGLVCMSEDGRYNRVTLFAAGGVKMEKWMGGAWTSGS